MQTLFAKKRGMAGRYTVSGDRVGTTVVEVLPTVVAGLRTKEKHGYEAVVVKSRIPSGKSQTREIRTKETPAVGMEIKVEDVLKADDVVKVTGTSRGKGFAGVVKRHGFAGGPRTHGQSDRERAPGSSGSGTTPGRVYKGKRRAGHMGADTVTVTGIKVLEVNPEKRLVTLIGSIPGHKNSPVRMVKV